MDWHSVTFDWNRVRAFLVTVEEGSLSAAARALGQAQPTLGRQVTALEQELGVALFERAGRGLMLTPAGLALVEHARAMAEAALKLSLTASGRTQAIEGKISITASEFYAAHLLPPILLRLREMAPGIEVEIVGSNQMVDLIRREADIAIRNARPAQGDLVARKLGEDSGTLAAATTYLDRIGRPKTRADLATADFIGFSPREELAEMLASIGYPVTLRNFVLHSANHLVQWEMMRAGLGIGVAPLRAIRDDPLLEVVLPEDAPIAFPVWLTTHRDLHTSRRVRLVFDLLAEEVPRLLAPPD